jgi:hypothetical protein
MKNEYTVNEVIEIGVAQEVILGEKIEGVLDENRPFQSSLDLDE